MFEKFKIRVGFEQSIGVELVKKVCVFNSNMEWSKSIIFIYKRHFHLACIWYANRKIKFRKLLTISYQDLFGKNITFVIDKINGYSSMLWYC